MAGQEKEKVEKRRALGRGLDSLLPGPRAVPAGAAPGHGAGAIGGQQVPHRAFSPVRNDIVVEEPARDDRSEEDGRNDKSRGVRLEGEIKAVVDDEAEIAELRSADAGAAVPT